MKVKQKSIRAFEFTIASPEDESELRSYIEQNLEILASFLIAIDGEVGEETQAFLEEKGLTYTKKSGVLHTKHKMVADTQAAVAVQKTKIASPETKGALHFNQPIRSGNELECDDDIVIFGRINSGAKVIAKKNAIIFSRIEGVVDALGDYLIIKEIGKGRVYFHGEEILADKIPGKTTKVSMKGGVIVYEEL